jgi:hypothetical protein
MHTIWRRWSKNWIYDCIKAFSETDFTEDLKKFDMTTLILHGDAEPAAWHVLDAQKTDQRGPVFFLQRSDEAAACNVSNVQ